MSKSTRKLRNTNSTVKTATFNSEQRNTGTTMSAVSRVSHISLEFVKPDAKKVYVAGTFNEWQPEKAPLVAVGDGRWVGDLAINPGRHEYLFVADGQWLPDPNAKESAENPYGGLNSVLTVSV